MVTLSPSSATRSITVEPLEVATSITISAPSTVKLGESFSITGILIRQDTGGPVPNALIKLYYNGSSIGSVTTGVDGDYIKSGVTFLNAGTWTLKATFAGGSGYAASAAQKPISVRGKALPSPIQIIPIALPIIVGVALWRST